MRHGRRLVSCIPISLATANRNAKLYIAVIAYRLYRNVASIEVEGIMRIFLAVAAFSWAFGVASAADLPTGPILFFTNLSADEESAPAESPGKGRADFSLDRSTRRLSWKVTYEGLTSQVTAANIHGPARPGLNADPIINLASKGLKSPLEGSVILDDSAFTHLIERHLYVNILTAKYKDGELRGHIERFNPKRTYPADGK